MKLYKALAVLSHLPASEADALDINALGARVPWVSKRTLQRYMEALAGGDSEFEPLPLVRRLEPQGGLAPAVSRRSARPKPTGRAYRYCLDTAALRQWFMTDHMALNLMLADQAIGASLGAAPLVGARGLAAQAQGTLRSRSPRVQRLSAYVRIVPDGMGRAPAQVDPTAIDAVLEAIAQGRKVRFGYASARGNDRVWEVSPRGVVAKDGTLYLVATQGLMDTPTTFALHRFRQAEVSGLPADTRAFDIDQFLEHTQQLSHPFQTGTLIKLRLRVAPQALYHFRERPLWGQVIDPPDRSGHVIVTADVVEGVMLVPFLLSMGPWVEVLMPPSVRAEVAQRVGDMAQHYRKTPGRTAR